MKNLLVVAITVTLIEGAVLGAQYGIVIGVEDYPGTANDLNYAVDDAIAVYQRLLSDPQLWSSDRIYLLVDSDATKLNFFHVLESLATGATANDTLFIYFSGHGTRAPDSFPIDEVDGYDEYLCTYGVSLADFVSDDELSATLEGVPFGRVIVVIDACFSGGELRAPGRTVKSLWSGLGGDGFLQDFRRLKLGPQDLDDLTGKQVVGLAAADDNQYAWEYGPPLEHGLFTYYFLEALQGWTDGLTKLDGLISGQEAFAYLSPRVLAISAAEGLNQVPQLFDNAAEELPILSVITVCFSYQLSLENAGWYMVSFPGVPCGSDDPAKSLADDLYPLFLFRFDPGLRSYRMYPGDPFMRIRSGWGYWVRVYEPPVLLDMDVWLPNGPAIVPLKAGWNQIGNPFPFGISLSQLRVRRLWEVVPLAQAQMQGWLNAFMFTYDPLLGGYVMISPEDGELQPGCAYWVRAYEDCDLIISAQSVPSPGSISAKLVYEDQEPPPPPVVPLPEKEGKVVARPNPIRGHGGAVFTVEGVCPCSVQALRVAIYDLSGRRVWEGEANGPYLTWSGTDYAGNPLANGVYLYLASARVNGVWRTTSAEKLVILR